MKITEVLPFYPNYQPAPGGWRDKFWNFGVEIHTDEGLIGIGAGGGGVAAIEIVKHALPKILIGRDPFDVEQLWEEMCWETIAYGRKGIAVMAISGVDIALWDLIGKIKNVPVYECLGSTKNTPVLAYATGENIGANIDSGFRAFKISKVASPADGTEGMRRNVERVANAREQIGSEAELMLDCWMGWNVDYTLEMAEQLAPYNLKWIEEPLIADDYNGYTQLTSEVSSTQIATGEHEFTQYGFLELIDRKAAHIIQPDVSWCGGITEAKKICDLANKNGVTVIPHRGGEVWGLHLVTAMQCPRAEIGTAGVKSDSAVEGVPELIDGCLSPFDKPGLGVKWRDNSSPSQ